MVEVIITSMNLNVNRISKSNGLTLKSVPPPPPPRGNYEEKIAHGLKVPLREIVKSTMNFRSLFH